MSAKNRMNTKKLTIDDLMRKSYYTTSNMFLHSPNEQVSSLDKRRLEKGVSHGLIFLLEVNPEIQVYKATYNTDLKKWEFVCANR